MAWQNKLGDRDGVDKAQQQHAGGGDGADKATAPPQAANGAERGGDRGAVGGRRRRMAESPSDVVASATMVSAAAHPGREGRPENYGGG